MPDSTTSSPSRASFFRTDSALGALRELLKAHEYAFDARCDKWNFAIEINALSKFGLSDTDRRWPARNQELVLTVFQEEGWPKEIDDPLVPIGGRQSKERLHDTIKNLNRSQKIRLIQFRGNGTGEGIVWQYTGKANKLMGINSFIEDTTSVASGVVAL